MGYKVGYREGVVDDPQRQAWRTDMPRPLAWSAWYPTSRDATVREKLVGPPGAEVFTMGAIAQGADINRDQARWPVVLLSHGTGGMAQSLAWLANHLAAAGFVALGVSHHGNTAMEPYLPEGFLCWWERARDLTVILDWAGDNGPLAGRLDLDSVFAAGFSLGGHTVLALAGATSDLALFQDWLAGQGAAAGGPREFPDLADHLPRLLAESEKFRQSMARQGHSYHDARVRAVATFAPAPPVRAFMPDSLRAITVPVSIVVGKGDLEAPHDACTLWLQQQNPAFGVRLLGDDVGHYVFLPAPTETGKAVAPELFRDPDGVDRHAIHRDAAAAAETLFRAAIN